MRFDPVRAKDPQHAKRILDARTQAMHIKAYQRMYRLASLNVVKPTTQLSPDNENLLYFFSKIPEVFGAAAEYSGMRMHTHAFRTDAGEFVQFEDYEKHIPELGQPHVMTMAVWNSMPDLMNFVYRDTVHGKAMRPLRDWVTRDEGPTLVLWWLAEGERFAPADAWERMQMLRSNGPTAEAFDLKHRFDAPDA